MNCQRIHLSLVAVEEIKKANTFKNLDEKISKNSEYIKVDTSNLNDFKILKKKLDSLKSKSKADKINLISYLSTPPQSYEDIIINIIKSEINKEEYGCSRIVIEKPFGQNLNSAKTKQTSKDWVQ